MHHANAMSIKNFSNIYLMIRGIPMSSHSTISSRFAHTGSWDTTLCRPLRRAHAVFAREVVTLTVQTLGGEEGNMPKEIHPRMVRRGTAPSWMVQTHHRR